MDADQLRTPWFIRHGFVISDSRLRLAAIGSQSDGSRLARARHAPPDGLRVN